MDRKTTVAILGLLLIVSLCLHLLLWLQIARMEREIQNLHDRPTILFPPAGSMRARPE